MNKWEELSLGEVAEIVGGGTPSSIVNEYWGGDVPWITPKDLSNYPFRKISEGERNISRLGLAKSSAQLLPKDTVLVTSRAPIGYVAISENELSTNQGFKSLVLKDGFDSNFFYYLIKNNVPVLEAASSGTTFKEISGGTMKKLKFMIPPFPIQRSIASILGSLDDKIELNRRMNETLEATARALYKSRFVDFDPVKAKAEGKKPFGMDEETAALFPKEFEESKLGKIPKGWRVGNLDDEFDVIMGQSPSGETYNEIENGLPFYQGRKDFQFRYPTLRVFCTKPTRIAEKDDTLVSVRAPVGDVNMAKEKCCIGRGLAAIRHKCGSRSFSYYSMKTMQDIFKSFEGEGTVFGSINKQQFGNLKIIIPPDKLISKYEEKCSSIDQEIEINCDESENLENIRDSLLPRLLSGELKLETRA